MALNLDINVITISHVTVAQHSVDICIVNCRMTSICPQQTWDLCDGLSPLLYFAGQLSTRIIGNGQLGCRCIIIII